MWNLKQTNNKKKKKNKELVNITKKTLTYRLGEQSSGCQWGEENGAGQHE